jgi:hypothetical protein
MNMPEGKVMETRDGTKIIMKGNEIFRLDEALRKGHSEGADAARRVARPTSPTRGCRNENPQRPRCLHSPFLPFPRKQMNRHGLTIRHWRHGFALR